MPLPSRDILVLSIGQALSTTVVSLLTSVSSLSGSELAPSPSLSTAPVTATVLGTLAMIYPASFIMASMGRRGGFLLKALIGIFGAIICICGLYISSFLALVIGTFILGIFNSFTQYYRFAAIDAARTSAERTSAVATVTGAGVVGGIAGPFLAGNFANAVAWGPYVGAFVAICIVCVFLAASQTQLSTDLGRAVLPASKKIDLTGAFYKRPDFIRASIICSVGFAVMTLTMNAAPLSLHHNGFHMDKTSIVLQVHFALMYLPSFFNARLVRCIGLNGLALLGVSAGIVGCFIGITLDPSLLSYVIQLGLSGIAWNFMFNSGTILLASTYSDAEKTKAQGVNSLFVFSSNVLASTAAGILMAEFDWRVLNLFCIPLLLVAVLSVASSKNPVSTSKQN